MRPFILLASLAACAAVGCSSTYAPQYHPVSVSNVNVAYPVVVHAGSPGAAGAVSVVPSAAPSIVLPPPPPPPPPGFFGSE